MGSLIKNAGGTIVPGGGYIAGRADLVAAAAARLTAPGVGIDAGGVSGSSLRLMAKGLLPTVSQGISPGTSAFPPLNLFPACSFLLETFACTRQKLSSSQHPPLSLNAVNEEHSSVPERSSRAQPRRREDAGQSCESSVPTWKASRQNETRTGIGPCAGLFLAPQMVGEALKGGRLVAEVMGREGYGARPPRGVPSPSSFITAVEVGSAARMTAFCRAVQRASPVGAYIQPTPGARPCAIYRPLHSVWMLCTPAWPFHNTMFRVWWAVGNVYRDQCQHGEGFPSRTRDLVSTGVLRCMHMHMELQSAAVCLSNYVCVAGVTPGYEDEVIFGDGTFIDGSTAELSADGPLRPPFVVYCQGGAHWTHWAIALESIVPDMRACAG